MPDFTPEAVGIFIESIATQLGAAPDRTTVIGALANVVRALLDEYLNTDSNLAREVAWVFKNIQDDNDEMIKELDITTRFMVRQVISQLQREHRKNVRQEKPAETVD